MCPPVFPSSLLLPASLRLPPFLSCEICWHFFHTLFINPLFFISHTPSFRISASSVPPEAILKAASWNDPLQDRQSPVAEEGLHLLREVAEDQILEVGNKASNVVGEVLHKYFHQRFNIIDKEDLSLWYPYCSSLQGRTRKFRTYLIVE
uniref:Uncharacterized protein n=1 Tax=Ananas comosus var. bracteatus TaxID=296719 RepID=A0A6V7PHV3_ANACO|nr:unnamed protein product [Ananas comosus var. bracteatus]